MEGERRRGEGRKRDTCKGEFIQHKHSLKRVEDGCANMWRRRVGGGGNRKKGREGRRGKGRLEKGTRFIHNHRETRELLRSKELKPKDDSFKTLEK